MINVIVLEFVIDLVVLVLDFVILGDVFLKVKFNDVVFVLLYLELLFVFG